jgi:hypothetical protein
MAEASMRGARRNLGVARVVVAAALVLLVAASCVQGPVVPSSGIGLGSGSFNLNALGYQKAEFWTFGTAHTYSPTAPIPTDGKLVVAADPETSAGNYKTRIVVFRPIDPAKFNGTVVVEWLNVTAGGDAPADWIMAHNELIRSGTAWVGVSAQKVGVDALVSGNSARYGSLVHPGDSYSYSIFSQAGQRIRDNAGAQVLGGLTPQRLIAAGESQSASRMVTYIDAIQPVDHVYDGFFVHSRFGSGAPLTQAPLPAVPFPAPAPIRDDLDVPVMVVETEGDVISSNLAARQADTPMFREWELAGTSHADAYTLQGLTDNGDGAAAAQMFEYLRTPYNPFGCTNPINAGPQHWILQAAFKGLDTWVRTGVAPPVGPPLEVISSSPVVLARDAYGNALGGVRSPHVDVPIATLNSVNSGVFFCALFGSTTPLTSEQLLALYPTHDDFVTKWLGAIYSGVANGFLLPADAGELYAAANGSTIPN